MAQASGKKILVVDDEPDVRNFLATCIEDAGFQVDTANDGAEALEKVQIDPPDLMTLDMVMPRVSGINLMRKLRKMDQFKRLPVIVITAHAHDELASEDLKSFSAFTSGLRPRYTLEKPVTPEKLVTAICDILAVKVDDTLLSQKQSDRDEIMRKVSETDAATLKQIQALLAK